MTASAPAAELAPGEVVAADEYRLSRSDLVRYAGASGDFNPLHWSPRIAAEAGLPGVIAHGTLLLGLVTRLLNGWLGDPACLTELTFRFVRPVVVPDDGVTVAVRARLAERRPDGRLAVTIEASVAGTGRVGRGQALVLP
ncbi:MaoC/PaaZ C-terminal domain-containing protein [Jiangella rhizosphaerae]|uniref:MaoC/PaaZ C-terminal domain-containing protein n=1 Tax=Jiangella rhizosphaerae TaxID=2293569 RepID=UPI0018F37B9F|nr:MaoC/PaaZ C-terminal domain-containing protein [Jiangella rhizosphaerae]